MKKISAYKFTIGGLTDGIGGGLLSTLVVVVWEGRVWLKVAPVFLMVVIVNASTVIGT